MKLIQKSPQLERHRQNWKDSVLGPSADKIANAAIQHYEDLLNNLTIDEKDLKECAQLAKKIVPLYKRYMSINQWVKGNQAYYVTYKEDGVFKKKLGGVGMGLIAQAAWLLIYPTFMELQNKFNALLNQEIKLTATIAYNNGQSVKLILEDNSLSHIMLEWGKNGPTRLKYDMQALKNMQANVSVLQDLDNLNKTYSEVIRRFQAYKKIILWNYNRKWRGYKTDSVSPFNEAYANFYLNAQAFNYPKQDQDIHVFMLHREYGAINADATAGFLIGDTYSADYKTHYAVKGNGASPQGFISICKDLEEMLTYGDLGAENIKSMLRKYTVDELNRTFKSHLKQATEEEMAQIFEAMQANGMYKNYKGPSA